MKSDDIEAGELTDEQTEERKAADGKPRKLNAEITGPPKVRRNDGGAVTSVVVNAKVKFKGSVTLHMRGDLAAAYWSVTPGMKIVALGFERGDKDYDLDFIEILAQP